MTGDRAIRYPRIPGQGRHPLAAAVQGSLVFAVVALLALVAWRVATGDLDLAGPGTGPRTQERWEVVGWVVLLALVPVLVHSGIMAFFGAADLGTPRRVVEGRVVEVAVRHRFTGIPVTLRDAFSNGQGRHYVAVDDGRSDPVRAWRISARREGQVQVGDDVRVSVSRWLGHVGRFQRPGAPRRRWRWR